MRNQPSFLDRFFSQWAEEFTRAIEMFTGEPARVAWNRGSTVDPQSTQSIENYLWWTQEFTGAEAFETWIGAPEPTRTRLGAVAGDEEGAQRLFLEMLAQAQKTTAELLSSQSGKQIRCGEGAVVQAIPAPTFQAAEITITIDETELPSLLYAIDPEIAIWLGESTGHRSWQSGAGDSPTGPAYGPMLQKMLDLELPLSVVLGRAVMPIQDVLKITSGSLIPLSQSVNDYAELVIHGKVVARGQVISFRGNYGIRIKEIMSPESRMALSSN